MNASSSIGRYALALDFRCESIARELQVELGAPLKVRKLHVIAVDHQPARAIELEIQSRVARLCAQTISKPALEVALAF